MIEANVRCAGRMHKILVTNKGQLVLCGHPKDSLEDSAALASLGAGEQRCFAIKGVWLNNNLKIGDNELNVLPPEIGYAWKAWHLYPRGCRLARKAIKRRGESFLTRELDESPELTQLSNKLTEDLEVVEGEPKTEKKWTWKEHQKFYVGLRALVLTKVSNELNRRGYKNNQLTLNTTSSSYWAANSIDSVDGARIEFNCIRSNTNSASCALSIRTSNNKNIGTFTIPVTKERPIKDLADLAEILRFASILLTNDEKESNLRIDKLQTWSRRIKSLFPTHGYINYRVDDDLITTELRARATDVIALARFLSLTRQHTKPLVEQKRLSFPV